MKKVLLLTGAECFGPKQEEYTIEDVFDMTMPSKVAYAKKHGYDILAIRSFGDGSKFGLSECTVGILRVLRCIEMLSFYDVVMWIDADSVITNKSMDIGQFPLNGEHVFYASYNWCDWSIPHSSMNTGNFILNRVPNLEAFVSAFTQLHRSGNFEEEQSIVNWLYKQGNAKNMIKILDPKYLQGVPNRLMEYRMTKYGDKGFFGAQWNSSFFLSHLPGIPNKLRVEILNNEYKEFLQ